MNGPAVVDAARQQDNSERHKASDVMSLGSLLLDVTPLRASPAFRKLWLGQLMSAIGGQITVFAIALEAFDLTKSSAAVGLIGLIYGIALIGCSLSAGHLGDRMDRRILVLAATLGQACVSVLLFVQAHLELNSVVFLDAATLLQSALGAINAPVRRTFAARLLPSSQIPAASALNTLVQHLSSISGPVLAGFLIARVGFEGCYLVDVCSFAAALAAVYSLPPMKPQSPVKRPSLAFATEGLLFLVGKREALAACLLDLCITVLGTPTALLPALTLSRFSGNPHVLGLLVAAPAIGGLLGATWSGVVGRSKRRIRTMATIVVGWGVCIAFFGWSHSLLLDLTALLLAGILDASNVILLSSVIQSSVPDRLRARVGSLEFIVGAGGPQLGTARAGALGSLIPPDKAAIIGGVSAVLAAVSLILFIPGLRVGSPSDDSELRVS